ncbi:MAG TPA: hypothetical protein VK524_19330 [Polyangiaceae bacterium]|nr:hypothetical protein [Polyangiaceae bacterium]
MSFRKVWMKRGVGLLAGASLLAGSFYAGVAYAADQRLDQAADNVTKAVALLEAAQNPDPKREFGGHRVKAIAHLKRGLAAIQKAKEFADRPAPPDKHKKHH